MLGCRYAPMVCAFSSKQIGEYHRLGRQSLIMSSTSDLTDNNPSRNIIRKILTYIYIYKYIRAYNDINIFDNITMSYILAQQLLSKLAGPLFFFGVS